MSFFNNPRFPRHTTMAPRTSFTRISDARNSNCFSSQLSQSQSQRKSQRSFSSQKTVSLSQNVQSLIEKYTSSILMQFTETIEDRLEALMDKFDEEYAESTFDYCCQLDSIKENIDLEYPKTVLQILAQATQTLLTEQQSSMQRINSEINELLNRRTYEAEMELSQVKDSQIPRNSLPLTEDLIADEDDMIAESDDQLLMKCFSNFIRGIH